jgi:aspartate aminotransferase-like enzyme
VSGRSSGLTPVVFGHARSRAFKVPHFRSLAVGPDCATAIYRVKSKLVSRALTGAVDFEEEGLDARWSRHERNHRALLESLADLGLSVLPREGERLWTLNAVKVPEGVDEAAVRLHLLETFNIEIGAGLGPLAGKIWRVGLMGASSSPRLIVLLRGALESALAKQRQRV